MRGGPTFDQERVTFNLARLKKGGATFEVVVDPDAVLKLKESGEGSVRDVVRAEQVFADAKRGELASEEQMKAIFGTSDFEQVAKTILDEGEVQLTAEYRNMVRERKLRQLITMIHRNAIDPKSGNPHPEKRIELAFEEAKVKVDELRTPEQQLQDVVRKLQPILPLRFEQAHLIVRVPSAMAGKLYGEVARLSKIVKDSWLDDGSWEAEVELPAGMKGEFIDELNNLTHGGATVEEKK